jgi:hypothetical protein
VPVAQHDRLDVAGRQLEEPHVVNEAVREDAGVEQHAARSTADRERDERQEAVLAAELLDDLASLECARCLAGRGGRRDREALRGAREDDTARSSAPPLRYAVIS